MPFHASQWSIQVEEPTVRNTFRGPALFMLVSAIPSTGTGVFRLAHPLQLSTTSGTD